MKYPRYPKYKPSGVEWLGEVPEHWRELRLKNIADIRVSNVDKKTVEGEEPVRLCNYVDVYYHARITPDIAFMDATATREQIQKFALTKGDVLITKDSETPDDIAVPAYVADDLNGVVCGYHLALIRPCASIVDGAFLASALSASGIRAQYYSTATGITRFGLSTGDISGALVPVPPLSEQVAIASFLDRETARIDALIAKKQRLIELLAEKRAALVSQAVTKGLNPDVPIKDSGVEWLGEIPAHWELKKFAHVARVVRGASPRPAGDVRYFNGDHIPWVTVADITKDRSKYLYETKSMLTQEGERYSRKIAADTLLLTNSGATLGVPKILKFEGCANDGVIAFLDLIRGASVDYLYFYLLSLTTNFRERTKQGAGQPNLNTDIVRSTWLPFPSSKEQQQIAAWLDAKTEQLETLVETITAGIERLQEHRAAIISVAVTGKIDVRQSTEAREVA